MAGSKTRINPRELRIILIFLKALSYAFYLFLCADILQQQFVPIKVVRANVQPLNVSRTSLDYIGANHPQPYAGDEPTKSTTIIAHSML